ncbi:MAG: hypothetical protein A3J29_23320 [Acidobacteria bacterium RIFCSPLOWO2_12_FULL_67_14b]|nr:MAG: hypothetical protein A3J29_23320 [Acidobacteria bacterium RIFCSPLOWO2_12_FULL_67_14b]
MRPGLVSSNLRSTYGFFFLWYTNQQAAAIAQLTHAVSDDPLSPTARYRLAVVLLAALTCAERAFTLDPRNAVVAATLAALLIRAGDTTRGAALWQPLLEVTGVYGVPLALMVFHLLGRELDRAAQWAHRAIDQRTPGVLQFVHMPIAAELRASSHWPALAERMRLHGTV